MHPVKLFVILGSCGILSVLVLFSQLCGFNESRNLSGVFKIPKLNTINSRKNLGVFYEATGEHINDSVGPVEPCRHPWETDEECKIFKICFARNNTFKPRALVSFPGSGNTWVRHLIEAATGFFTGSVYNDKVLFGSGYLGEKRSPYDGTTIVQKTHDFNNDEIRNRSEARLIFEYRGILLIRNPFDALVSNLNYIITRNHTGYADAAAFRGKKWQKYVRTTIGRWANLTTKWIENSNDYLIILYENVCKNPEQQVQLILEYLKLKIQPDRLKCLLKKSNLKGKFHRNNPNNLVGLTNYLPSISTMSQIEYYSPEKLRIVKMIQNKIDFLNSYFKTKGLSILLPYTLETSAKKYVYL